jgi:hypothetical protein
MSNVISVKEFNRRSKARRKKGKRVIKQVIALRNKNKRTLRAREKIALKHERVVSPRHTANLIQPSQPFAILQMKGDYLSTAIYQFDYDPGTLTLKVQFWKVRIRNKRVVSRSPGGIYMYFEVPSRIYENFVNASSKGRYFYYNIRGRFTKGRIG